MLQRRKIRYPTSTHNWKREIKEGLQEFKIIFPWNFRYRSAPGFEAQTKIRDVTFRRLPHPIWEEYKEEACDEGSFDEFLEELPTQQPRENPLAEQRYWEVEYKAADARSAINRIEYALEILLGKITYASHCFRQKRSVRPGIWNYGVTTLQKPICYLVHKNDEFYTYYSSTDFTPRRRSSLSGGTKDRFEEAFPKLPDFEGELNQVEEHLATALRTYHAAMSEPDTEQCFLNYWRCLEAATLTQDESYGAADPLKRARAAARPQIDRDFSDSRIENMAEKRNALVHKGGQVNITEGDLGYLKTQADHCIWFLATNMENCEFDKFRDYFRFGSKTEAGILQSKGEKQQQIEEKNDEIEELEDEIDSIDQVIDWLDIDEEDYESFP